MTAAVDTVTVVAVVLAAGGGSRFQGDGHKLLAELPATPSRPSESVAARSLAAAAGAVTRLAGDGRGDRPDTGAARADHLVVVTGSAALDGVIEAVRVDGGLDDRLVIVHNPHWADGQATSLQAGLGAVRELGGDVAVVGLADQPDVTTATWLAVVAAATGAERRPIAIATYDGRPRNPVALASEVWEELPASGDRGARDLIRLMPERVTQVPSSGSPADIDTVEDLRRWQNI